MPEAAITTQTQTRSVANTTPKPQNPMRTVHANPKAHTPNPKPKFELNRQAKQKRSKSNLNPEIFEKTQPKAFLACDPKRIPQTLNLN